VSDPGGGTAARTIFLGSGGFAVPAAEALARDPRINLLGVVLAPAAPEVHPALDLPVAQWAARRGVGTYRPARLRDPSVIDGIARGAPDLLVLADYGKIVPQQILDLPRFGALNLHPSLLPRHRGATPIEAAILEGDKETGVSLMRMDAGLDTGPLIAQRRVPLRRDETAPQLEGILAGVAAELLTETLGPWLAGQLAPVPQAVDGVTLTRPLRREDGRLDPSRGIEFLDRQIRALQPWPGTFVETQFGRVKVLDARPLEAGSSRTPGQLIRLPANRLALAARDGLLELVDVQPAGGRRMSGAELLRGRPALAGSIVLGSSPEEGGSSA
jgi:methionyl-tRNA formyltransferase